MVVFSSLLTVVFCTPLHILLFIKRCIMCTTSHDALVITCNPYEHTVRYHFSVPQVVPAAQVTKAMLGGERFNASRNILVRFFEDNL